MQRSGEVEARALAARAFLGGQRVDVGRIAEELGVNRVTLYRWVGTRDKLLVEVLWSLAHELLRSATERAGGRGAERVVRVLVEFLDAVVSSPAMQRFLADEGELALRLLTRADREFQPRLVAAVEELLIEEGLDAGPVGVAEMARVVVRITESYAYLDMLTGQRVDARRAEPVLRLLLR